MQTSIERDHTLNKAFPLHNFPRSSGIDFTTSTRVFVNLEVSDLQRSLNFYQTLFNQKVAWKEDYEAGFESSNPPMNLRLVETSKAATRDGHFGIQLKYTKSVNEYQKRLSDNGIDIELEEAETACCFSVANKVWVRDPDDNLWEVYVLLEENSSEVRCGDSCACEAEGCG